MVSFSSETHSLVSNSIKSVVMRVQNKILFKKRVSLMLQFAHVQSLSIYSACIVCHSKTVTLSVFSIHRTPVGFSRGGGSKPVKKTKEQLDSELEEWQLQVRVLFQGSLYRPYFLWPRKYRHLLSEPTDWPRLRLGQNGKGNDQAGIFEDKGNKWALFSKASEILVWLFSSPYWPQLRLGQYVGLENNRRYIHDLEN